MIAVGLLLVLVGFFLIAVRSGDVSARSSRSVSIGRQWSSVPSRPDRGYDGMPSRRNRLIRVLGGLVMIVGGFVIIAMSS
jgi:hypothetical protein